MKLVNITVYANEWFDKVNGNSYFSARIILNEGSKEETTLLLPFQYGYENYYLQAASEKLEKEGFTPDVEKYGSGGIESLYNYCQRKKIIFRYNKVENCKKRELYGAFKYHNAKY
jgi:hypothetical protein